MKPRRTEPEADAVRRAGLVRRLGGPITPAGSRGHRRAGQVPTQRRRPCPRGRARGCCVQSRHVPYLKPRRRGRDRAGTEKCWAGPVVTAAPSNAPMRAVTGRSGRQGGERPFRFGRARDPCASRIEIPVPERRNGEGEGQDRRHRYIYIVRPRVRGRSYGPGAGPGLDRTGGRRARRVFRAVAHRSGRSSTS